MPDESSLDVSSLAAKIAQEVAKQLRGAMLPDALLDSGELATLLGCTRNHFTDRVAKHPNFPRAVRIPSLSSELGVRRWKRREVLEWIERQVDRGARSRPPGA
jgi:predicted DNA-binding transcriptional regulator AlpA